MQYSSDDHDSIFFSPWNLSSNILEKKFFFGIIIFLWIGRESLLEDESKSIGRERKGRKNPNQPFIYNISIAKVICVILKNTFEIL